MKPITRKPPTALNVAITFFSLALYLKSLWTASHGSSPWAQVAGVIVFACVGNTLFSILHESVHGIFSDRYWINEVFGQIAAACFPTGLSFQRTCHLSHHLRNRTDYEIFDMYYPGDNRFLKNLQFYSILNGCYWLSVWVGWLLYLAVPWSYKAFEGKLLARKQTDVVMLLPFLNHPKKRRIRLELLMTVAFQAGLFVALDLRFWPTLACFWAFGLYWGALQYADHAWSPRDIRAGAWNLKVGKLTQYIFLNYHYHQVHHMNPKLPWIHLPRHVDPRSPKPHFWKIYLEMWKGPKPINAPPPKAIDDALKEQLTEDWQRTGS